MQCNIYSASNVKKISLSATRWINMEKIMLSEVSQLQKDK